jgi:Holliday junction resolvase RusA-like endonuclease
MKPVRFAVYGRAQTQGSKKAVRAGKFAKVVDANPGTKEWRRLVGQVAGEAMEEGGHELMRGAVHLALTFFFARPKSHYGTGRNAGVLKDSAPARHTKKPDLSKLTRAVEDALSGIVYLDDSQVVWQDCGKGYGDPERVEVIVYHIGD